MEKIDNTHKLLKIVLVATLSSIFILFYYQITYSSNLYLPCLFHAFTGFSCPGCGSQRAIHLLLHGDFLNALRHNALLVFALPGIIYFGLGIISNWIFHTQYRLSILYNKRFLIIILAITMLFGLIRNLSSFLFS